MRRDTKKAFTFIELLVAISIFSVIAVSIHSVFNTGVFVWRRLNTAADVYQQSSVALELMGSEIANYIPSQKVKLQGNAEEISFLGKFKNEGVDKLSRICFFLEQSTNTLMRSQEDFKSVLNTASLEGAGSLAPGNDKSVVTEEFLTDVKALEFKYFCRNKEQDKYEWVDSLDPEDNSSCLAVSISINAGVSITKIVHLYVKGKDEQQAL